MKLAAYLAEAKLTHEQFAKLIGATQAAVSRYASGQRKPQLEKLLRIEKATGGKVTPRDFASDVETEAA